MNKDWIVVAGLYILAWMVSFASKLNLLEVSKDAGALISMILLCTGILYYAITQVQEDKKTRWLFSSNKKTNNEEKK